MIRKPAARRFIWLLTILFAATLIGAQQTPDTNQNADAEVGIGHPAAELNANRAAGKKPSVGTRMIVDDPVIYTGSLGNPKTEYFAPPANSNFSGDYDIEVPALDGKTIEAVWYTPLDNIFAMGAIATLEVTTSEKKNSYHLRCVAVNAPNEKTVINARVRIRVHFLLKDAPAAK